MNAEAVQQQDLLLSRDEVQRLVGGYRQHAKQLEELHRQGFWRARRSRITGEVILEREHYDAVCAGRLQERATPGRRSAEPVLMP